MSERLRSDDMAFLVTESASTPMHNATLEVFEPPSDGFDYDRLVGLIADRIAFVPRYRQRLRHVPGRLASPVWVDDDDFDLTYHVRRSAVPRPGSMDQLRDLTARIVSRQLDRHRSLWEVYLIEGLEHGRFAILTKSHQVLVDGVSTVDLGQVILDVDPSPRDTVHDDWRPDPPPGTPTLLADAIGDTIRHPRRAAATVRDNAETLLRSAGVVGSRALDLVGSLSNRSSPDSPLSAVLSEQRRFATVKTTLEDYRRVRRVHGGTVNDVVLATITGAIRGWLMTRAEPVGRSFRAMVPMGVIDSDLEPTSLGSQVAGHLLSLPIGEPSPVVRLHQVSYALKAHKETGRAVAADRLAGIAGFAPTTFHALGNRVAAAQTRRGFHLVVTNVPGPQFPLYAAGASMLESYPVPPLLPGHAVSIGVTSYDAHVYFGLTGDRDAVPDLDVLAQCLVDALEELVDRVSESRGRAPRRPPNGTAGSEGKGGAAGRRSSRDRRQWPEGPGMSTRVYVPSSWTGLRDLVMADGIGPPPFPAHAVTDGLRAAWAEGSEEDWEYAATTAASRSSLALIDDGDAPRRVVVAVDVDTVTGLDGDDPTLVEVVEAEPFRRVAAVLVDLPEAEVDVRAAVARWADAQAGDAEAEALVEAALDHELAWYASQEIGQLLG